MRAPASRWTTPTCTTTATPWPAPCSRACCRTPCPTYRVSTWPWTTGRGASPSASEATSTTCSPPVRAAGALVIGDVCGKGVEAAALTGARYALRTAAVLTSSPAAALAIVNDTLLPEDWHHRFATLALLAVDLARGRSGSPSPAADTPRRCCDGRRDGHRVEAPGTIVGTLPEARFSETTFDLTTGDCLFLYTDGIVEAGAPGEMFGDERSSPRWRPRAPARRRASPSRWWRRWTRSSPRATPAAERRRAETTRPADAPVPLKRLGFRRGQLHQPRTPGGVGEVLRGLQHREVGAVLADALARCEWQGHAWRRRRAGPRGAGRRGRPSPPPGVRRPPPAS